VETHAFLDVKPAHEAAELGAEHARQRLLVGRDHVDLEVAGAQRRGDLEPDEAGTDDDGARRLLGLGDQRAAVARLRR